MFAALLLIVCTPEPSDELLAALREPAPPVVIHQWVFDRPVAVQRIVTVDPAGRERTGPSPVEIVGTGLIVGVDDIARIVQTGDRIFSGQLVFSAVMVNAGKTTVRLELAEEPSVKLAPGQHFYVGSQQKLLGPQHLLATTADQSQLGPPTHKAQCSCDCGGSAITIEARIDTDCSTINGTRCQNTDGTTSTTKDCVKIIVPNAL